MELFKTIYKIYKNTKNLRILGENFVSNNENKCNVLLKIIKKERIKNFIPINNLKSPYA